MTTENPCSELEKGFRHELLRRSLEEWNDPEQLKDLIFEMCEVREEERHAWATFVLTTMNAIGEEQREMIIEEMNRLYPEGERLEW